MRYAFNFEDFFNTEFIPSAGINNLTGRRPQRLASLGEFESRLSTKACRHRREGSLVVQPWLRREWNQNGPVQEDDLPIESKPDSVSDWKKESLMHKFANVLRNAILSSLIVLPFTVTADVETNGRGHSQRHRDNVSYGGICSKK